MCSQNIFKYIFQGDLKKKIIQNTNVMKYLFINIIVFGGSRTTWHFFFSKNIILFFFIMISLIIIILTSCSPKNIAKFFFYPQKKKEKHAHHRKGVFRMTYYLHFWTNKYMHQYKREHRVIDPCIISKLNLMVLYRSNHHLSFLLPTEWIHVSQTVTWSLDWRHTDHTLKGMFCSTKIIHRRRICAYLHSTNASSFVLMIPLMLSVLL